ncbi:MAG: hypothetical protein Q9222_003550 [Ikaeria aurantiellina]
MHGTWLYARTIESRRASKVPEPSSSTSPPAGYESIAGQARFDRHQLRCIIQIADPSFEALLEFPPLFEPSDQRRVTSRALPLSEKGDIVSLLAPSETLGGSSSTFSPLKPAVSCSTSLGMGRGVTAAIRGFISNHKPPRATKDSRAGAMLFQRTEGLGAVDDPKLEAHCTNISLGAPSQTDDATKHPSTHTCCTMPVMGNHGRGSIDHVSSAL